jgi:hypothetical protein
MCYNVGRFYYHESAVSGTDEYKSILMFLIHTHVMLGTSTRNSLAFTLFTCQNVSLNVTIVRGVIT